MKLYFIRHGETDWNRELKIQGQTDNPLNETGRQEAKKASACLKCVSFDAAFTSPLIRARETAETILEGKDCRLLEDPRLIEISYGCREGQSLKWIKKLPVLRLYNYFYHTERYHPPKGGETIAELFARCRDFLNEIARREDEWDGVLIAAHGGLIRGMICVTEGLSEADFWSGNNQKNCSVTVLECKNSYKVLKQAVS